MWINDFESRTMHHMGTYGLKALDLKKWDVVDGEYGVPCWYQHGRCTVGGLGDVSGLSICRRKT